MKQIIILLFIFLSVAINVRAQSKAEFNTAFETLFSSSNELPFWLIHNQYGRYPLNSNATQLISLEGSKKFEKLFSSPLDLTLGANLISSYSNEFNANFNELFARLAIRNWRLEGGLFHEPTYFGGISSTNGNIDRSNNARPYPRIRLATDEFVPFLFWKSWLSFKAEYDEGLLNDEREVKNTHLHHKALHLKIDVFKVFDMSFGLNHYVMWGGISPKYGELPNSFKNYITYITGGTGTYEFPQTDQLNVAGNQFGSYLLQFNFKVNDNKVTTYINHPFDDHSGMELYNYEDNLYGIFVDFGKSKLFEKVIYEYMYTCDQSGNLHIIGVMTGKDDYYNHGYYLTGYTYNGYGMCTPLFSPIVPEKGKRAIKNTRVSMHHIGFTGTLSENLKWNSKMTLSRNWGTFFEPFEEPVYQFSSLFNFEYSSQAIPFDLALSLAADFGKLYENRAGVMLKLSKSW